MVLALLAVSAFTLTYGQAALSPSDLGRAMFGGESEPVMRQIVLDIRLPRVATGALAGAALACAGVLMQALFRNPMADAWSLGLLAGGQMGVALIVTAAAFAGPSAVAFLTVFQSVGLTTGALLGVATFALVMAAIAKRVGSITLLVVGLMLGFTVQGLVSVIIHFANRVGGRVFSGWNDGTFTATQLHDLPWLAGPILLGGVLAVIAAKGLSAMLLGDNYARSMGVDVTRLRRLTLAAVVLLVAPVTAFCGPVTFIGLIVPHFARALVRSAKVLPLLPAAAVLGALLAVSADAIVHLPWEQHFLHLNAILAIVGAPVVIALILFSPLLRGQR
jgi:iron complex transport system permease protein